MSIDIPTSADFAELTQRRNGACVTIYVSASGSGTQAITHDVDAARTSLRSSLSAALQELSDVGVSAGDRSAITEHVDRLFERRLFWATGARSLAVFVDPEGLTVFRLMNRLPSSHSAGDRFDVGPMVRAVTFEHTGYVLAITEGDVRLVQLTSDATHHRLDLDELPDDAADVLTRDPATGRFNRHRADGTLGPKVEQRRYASIVQDAVLAAIDGDDAPLVLAAASDLDPAYREVNSHRSLLDEGISGNPASLTDDDLAARGRKVLDSYYAKRLADWRETFGTRQANGRATSQLSEIARAAWAGQVDEMAFDLDYAAEGTIDEFGVVTMADEASAESYRVVDEIAAQVLRTGGKVKAFRSEDLPGDSPIAATLRG